MFKKLKLEIKDVTEKFRANRKYTSLERVKEVEKIVLHEIHNKSLEQRELLLELALEIGHPLKVRKQELKEDLELLLQLVLIELIKCLESQNKDTKVYQNCLEAINDKLYTVAAFKLRQLMPNDQHKFRYPIFGTNQRMIQKEIQQILNNETNHSFLQEKRDAEYVEQIKSRYYKKNILKKFSYSLIIIYFGIIFKKRQWLRQLNQIHRFALFAFAGLVLVHQIQN